jgi:hypothetical protein
MQRPVVRWKRTGTVLALLVVGILLGFIVAAVARSELTDRLADPGVSIDESCVHSGSVPSTTVPWPYGIPPCPDYEVEAGG